jgi:hypothetical protein
MTSHLVVVAAGALFVIILTELIAAALPVVIVIALVPPEQREALARLLAVCDSSRKLRLWKALRIAVRARRAQIRATQRRRPRAEANLFGVEMHFHGEDVNLRREEEPDRVRR